MSKAVEEALNELRETFPDKVVDVKHWHGGYQTRAQDEATLYDYWDVMIYEGMPSVYPRKWTGATLDDAMAHMRIRDALAPESVTRSPVERKG